MQKRATKTRVHDARKQACAQALFPTQPYQPAVPVILWLVSGQTLIPLPTKMSSIANVGPRILEASRCSR